MKQLMVLFDFPTVNEQQYKAWWDELRSTGYEHPNGLIFHVSGPKPEGGLLITDVWESEQAFNEFSKVLMPIIARENLPPMKPLVMPVSYLYEGEHTVNTMG